MSTRHPSRITHLSRQSQTKADHAPVLHSPALRALRDDGGFRFTFHAFRFPLSTFRFAPLLLLLALSSPAQPTDDKQSTFFMGRVRYNSSEGNDCSGVGQDLMRLVSRASTLKIQEERKIRLTDPELF